MSQRRGKIIEWKIHSIDLPVGKTKVLASGMDEFIVDLSSEKEAAIIVRTGNGENKIKVLDFSGKSVVSRDLEAQLDQGLAFSPDKTLIGIMEKRHARVIEISTGRILCTTPFAPFALVPVRIAPNNCHIAIVADDARRQVKLWNLSENKSFREFVVDGIIHGVEIAPNGKILAAFIPGIVFFFDVESGNLIQKQVVDGRPLTCLKFSPDGQKYVTGQNDGRLRLFSTPRAGKGAGTGKKESKGKETKASAYK